MINFKRVTTDGVFLGILASFAVIVFIGGFVATVYEIARSACR